MVPPSPRPLSLLPAPPSLHALHVLLLLLPLGVAGACTSDAHERDPAVVAFDSFQQALLRGDRAAVRRLLAADSRSALEHLPLTRAVGKQPLHVVGVERGASETLVHVIDPNEGGRRSTFVVVVEDGERRIDLIATAGHSATERWLPGPAERLVQRPLTPREMATFFSRAENAGR